MKRMRFNHAVMMILIVLAAIFFVLQLLIFHNIEETGFLFFQDMMFLPLHILLVTFILDRIISTREKRERLQQIHIVISAFFSEIGTGALLSIGAAITDRKQYTEKLDMKQSWGDREFAGAAEFIKGHVFRAAPDVQTLVALRMVLPQKKGYLLQMFSNPNLLEHDAFTDMLWALYHLTDELENRDDFSALPEADIRHLSGDITRAYGLLTLEWVNHMKYLKMRYPYLWSIAVRKNPFTQNSIIVSE